MKWGVETEIGMLINLVQRKKLPYLGTAIAVKWQTHFVFDYKHFYFTIKLSAKTLHSKILQ